MTLTTYNRSADHVMGVSKTGHSSVSPGAILGIARGRVMTQGGAYWPSHRRKLFRLRRAKHRGTLIKYGWRSQLLWLRLTWRSHWRPSALEKIALVKKFGRMN